MKTALIAVDVQYDFLPGGALPVPDGDKIISPLRTLAQLADLTIATADVHAAGSDHFTRWPEHCIRGTNGVHIHPHIYNVADMIIEKGDGGRDGYSAFENPKLAAVLFAAGIERVVVGGLVREICVRATAEDADKRGFHTVISEWASRDLDEETSRKALGDIEKMVRVV